MLRNFIKKFRKFNKTKAGGFLVKFTAAFLATLLLCGVGLWGAYTYVFGKMEQGETLSQDLCAAFAEIVGGEVSKLEK